MSTNRFKTIKPKLQDNYKKDLTPKGKMSQKYSPVYSSFRGGATLKTQLSNRIKILRPSTSKHSQSQQSKCFHSKINQEKKQAYNSTRKIQITRANNNYSNSKKNVEYQSRSKSKSPLKQQDQIVRQQIYITLKNNYDVPRQAKTQNNNYPALPKVLEQIANFQSAKHSLKSNGLIRAYSASTNQGPIRDYNEDRVAIILNISKPEHCHQWKKAAYFGVFDGHGGVDCPDFLRDNLHNFVTKQKQFPKNMIQALAIGFEKCQKVFLQRSKNNHKVDRSGSCAIVTFFYGQKCYIANVGDSRAIMSFKQGKYVSQLSIDHKASDQYEQKRIIQSGGKIYQTKLQNSNPNIKILYEGEQHNFIMGPHRVLPGRLSVSRSFGDIQAKLPQFKGNQNAIICTPEIRSITITSDHDFILLASDGIYDKLTNCQIVQMVWETFTRDRGRFKTLHQFCGLAVENIMRLAFHKKTLDNITVVIIALEGLQNYFNKLQINSHPTNLVQNRKMKVISKAEENFQRKYIGRSTSPTNYTALRSKSFFKN